MSGPRAAALVAFGDFDSLPRETGPSVRSLHTVDAVFGAIVFIGVLVEPAEVEIVGFADDPDCWDLVNDDPDD